MSNKAGPHHFTRIDSNGCGNVKFLSLLACLRALMSRSASGSVGLILLISKNCVVNNMYVRGAGECQQ